MASRSQMCRLAEVQKTLENIYLDRFQMLNEKINRIVCGCVSNIAGCQGVNIGKL